jgi:hypothetical protein
VQPGKPPLKGANLQGFRKAITELLGSRPDDLLKRLNPQHNSALLQNRDWLAQFKKSINIALETQPDTLRELLADLPQQTQPDTLLQKLYDLPQQNNRPSTSQANEFSKPPPPPSLAGLPGPSDPGLPQQDALDRCNYKCKSQPKFTVCTTSEREVVSPCFADCLNEV